MVVEEVYHLFSSISENTSHVNMFVNTVRMELNINTHIMGYDSCDQSSNNGNIIIIVIILLYLIILKRGNPF